MSELPYMILMLSQSPELIGVIGVAGLCTGMGLIVIGSLFGFIVFKIFPALCR